MKPCSSNRKLIAALALNELDGQQEKRLRAHLETCAECRAYLNEAEKAAQLIASVELRSDIETSETFHRALLGKLRAEPGPSVWSSLWSGLPVAWPDWRVAAPIVSAALLVLALVLSGLWRAADPAVKPTGAPLPQVKNDLDPTMSNYQMLANRSLESLDELLTRQGNRNPSPLPTYTAATLVRAGVVD